jgi:hypothetical protein
MTRKTTRPICRASAVDLLAGADTASPRSSLASGRSGNAAMVSARAMHSGLDHQEHGRALASIMSPHTTTSTVTFEQSP